MSVNLSPGHFFFSTVPLDGSFLTLVPPFWPLSTFRWLKESKPYWRLCKWAGHNACHTKRFRLPQIAICEPPERIIKVRCICKSCILLPNIITFVGSEWKLTYSMFFTQEYSSVIFRGFTPHPPEIELYIYILTNWTSIKLFPTLLVIIHFQVHSKSALWGVLLHSLEGSTTYLSQSLEVACPGFGWCLAPG